VWLAVEADWRTAPVDDGLRATLGFIETLTLRPEDLTRDDARRVLAAGVSEEALVDAIHVAALFNMIVRLADSLGWDVPPFEAFLERADAMLAGGYSLDS
jgi:alkylhydroperoxidase family enzyme